jgi:hypothetical protein
MPGQVFGPLADVEHAASVEVIGVDERGAGDVVAGGGPRCHSAVEFTDEVVVPDLGRLPGDLGVLVGVAHDDQRPVRRGEPAQPGGEHRAQRDGDRPGHMGCGEAIQWAGIDENRAVIQVGAYRVNAHRWRRRFVVKQCRTDPVDFSQPPEVGRVAAQRAEKF